jgi:periplasmic nitrate reductase NapD
MTKPPTRRALFTGPFASTEPAIAHAPYISSAVISVLPKHRDDVLTRLENLPGAEVRHSNASKFVVVLEGPGSGALGAMLSDISGWPGVLSANMVFEQRLDEET